MNIDKLTRELLNKESPILEELNKTKEQLKKERQKKTILIVDDSEINVIVLTLILKKEGYTILVASDGQEAVDIFKSKPIDMIYMDVMMPVMDGFEATKAIRQYEKENGLPECYIIGFTGFLDTKEQCLTCGMNDVFHKPMNKKEIVSKTEKEMNLEKRV